jgi:hypothetical protein
MQEKHLSRAPVAHAYNPSYSGGRDQEDCRSKPARKNSSRDPISKKPFTKIGLENVVSIHNGILCSHEEEQNVIIRR